MVRFARCETGLRPQVKYLTDRSKALLLFWIIYVIFVLFLLCFPARLFIDALWQLTYAHKSITKQDRNNIKIHKRSTALGQSVKYFTGGLKPVSRPTNLIKTHRCLVCIKDPNLAMHHLLEHIKQDIKGDKAKTRTQQ